jgi:hypothetical protein
MRLRRQLELRGQVLRLRRGVAGDAVVLEHLVDREHVQRAVLVRDAGGLRELVDHRAHGALVACIGHFVHAADGASADIDLLAVGRQRHGASARQAGRP